MSELTYCVATVSLPLERKIGKKSYLRDVLRCPVPRVHSWRRRIRDIIVALDSTDTVQLGRAEMETLFGLQRRAALRLMKAVEPSIEGNEWRIERNHLLTWLRDVAAAAVEEDARSMKLRQAMRDAASQKLYVKAELHRLGKPEPACWEVAPEAFSAEVNALPQEIALGTGSVTVTFPPHSPELGAKLLHQLSLAMLSDWQGFCLRTGYDDTQRTEERIERLLEALEADKLEGVKDAGRQR
jgi:hypothetical protein